MAEGAIGFEWYDYAIFIATLVISLGIGVYFGFAGGRQKTTGEYLMGNRSLRVVPVALSMFMSYVSAIVVLGSTAEMYLYGGQQWLAGFGSAIAFIIGTQVFVPLFYPLKVTSSFEYLEMRFKSSTVKLTGTLLMMLSQVLYMGIAMYSPATALESVTGIPTWVSIVATGVVATIYTSMGGIKAVVWTDVFQAFVLVGGLIVILIAGIMKVGSIEKMWSIIYEDGRLDMFNFDPNPLVRMSFWSVVVRGLISATQTVGTSQTSVQRYCALPTLSAAKWSAILNIPLMIFLFTLTCAVGFVVYSYYSDLGCDPLRSGQIGNSNQLLPFFIVDALKIPALPGLFVAVLFSGALSTLSSSLNSLSAVTWKDLMEWKFLNIQESRKALITKLLVALYGVIAVGMAFLSEILGGHVLQASLSFVSGVSGPVFGLFILGAFFPRANWIGAIVGAWCGLALAMISTLGNYITKPHAEVLDTKVHNCTNLLGNVTIKEPPTNPQGVFFLFRISFMWYAAMGTLCCVIIGYIVSLLTGPEDPRDQDPRLVIPVAERLLCCLPKSVRRKCWWGIDFDSVEVDEHGNYVKEKHSDPVSSDSKNVDDERKTIETGSGPEDGNKEYLPAFLQHGISQRDRVEMSSYKYDNYGFENGVSTSL